VHRLVWSGPGCRLSLTAARKMEGRAERRASSFFGRCDVYFSSVLQWFGNTCAGWKQLRPTSIQNLTFITSRRKELHRRAALLSWSNRLPESSSGSNELGNRLTQ